ANEWEAQQALILSISFSEALEDLENIRNLASILNVAHNYLDIYVFGDQEEYKQYAQFLSLISQHPNFESIMENTRFIDSRRLLRWTRDFGPIFGFGIEGQLATIDPVYRDMMKPLEEKALHAEEPLSPLRDLFNLHGDAMPSEVAALMQTEFNLPIDIARPPVSMDGGDFISDGQGNVFISRQTLIRNGGNRSELESIFKNYFGAKQLHILEALPGRTVPHLDMIVKFLDQETIVLPEFQAPAGKAINAYYTDLNRQARQAIDHNERYLRKLFPKHKFLKVPMPPILVKSREEIVAEARQKFVQAYALEKALVDADTINRLNDTQLIELERQVLRAVKQEMPSADFDSTAAFDAVLRHYGQLPLDAYIDHYSEPATRYRSYINSVFLHAKDGKQAFLVPRFTSSDSQESALLSKWEAEVEKAYTSAWPKANIHWINCDSMVSDFGFLHCATVTVPLLERN
ncbi:MAG: agmatine deiminase family protein, partial [Verrucomicrobiae bacterium]|nr:agmatine deiminase family protein [Verrucomicrobiae bacterium]